MILLQKCPPLPLMNLACIVRGVESHLSNYLKGRTLKMVIQGKTKTKTQCTYKLLNATKNM